MPNQPVSVRRIALLFDRTRTLDRAVLRGALRWIGSETAWLTHVADAQPWVLPALREWEPDGVLANIEDPELADGLRALACPVVDVSGNSFSASFAEVALDYAAIGTLAAQHLLELGHTRIAFFGSANTTASDDMRAGAATALHGANRKLQSFRAEQPQRQRQAESWVRAEEELERWLLQLERPSAVLVDRASAARVVADACTVLGLLIPEEIAIISAEDDDFHCALASPGITSVQAPARAIGRTAAQRLASVMRRGATETDPPALKAKVILARASTDAIATDDHVVRRAVAHLRAHLSESITVDHLAEATGCARRTLERRCRVALGRSVHEELTRQRVALATALIRDTEQPLDAVARHAGFQTTRRMNQVFRQTTNRSASDRRSGE